MLVVHTMNKVTAMKVICFAGSCEDKDVFPFKCGIYPIKLALVDDLYLPSLALTEKGVNVTPSLRLTLTSVQKRQKTFRKEMSEWQIRNFQLLQHEVVMRSILRSHKMPKNIFREDPEAFY